MKASELKAMHLMQCPDSHLFDREAMSYFGDTMHNFGVKKQESGGWLLYRKRGTNKYKAGTGYLFSHNFRFVSLSQQIC